jgi:predicted Rossmann-fold nucleotide-binding protein
MLPTVCRHFSPESSYSHTRAIALGEALAAAKRQLVYGGGSKGIMGIVSGAVLGAGGDAVGVIPHAMLAAGGEGERVPVNGVPSVFVKLEEEGRERVGVIVPHCTPVTELRLRWNGYG